MAREKRGDREPEGLSDLAKAGHRAEPYFRAASSLLSGVALGVGLGYLADARLGTKPWLLVAGSFGGMAVGFYAFVKALQDAERKRSSR